MAWNEKPPILTGRSRDDLQNLRDYLFRMAQSLEEATGPASTAVTVSHAKDGSQVLKPGIDKAAVEAVRKNAEELKALIIKNANELGQVIIEGDASVREYADRKEEVYDSRYLAISEFGTFEEDLTNRIETTARGVVESYNYASAIESTQDSIDLLQNYYETINGEIRRGLVEDPDNPGTYIIGIVISQQVTFAGVVGESDAANPHDGYTYYYVAPNQTFGIYTATGWQFWINGTKRGWFSSQDSMLHVSNIYVESALRAGPDWEITFSGGFGIKYIGG